MFIKFYNSIIIPKSDFSVIPNYYSSQNLDFLYVYALFSSKKRETNLEI